MMKALFWVLAAASIAVGLFISFVCWLAHGLGLNSTVFGEAVCIAGMFGVVVSIVGVVLGARSRRKHGGKRAVLLVLLGAIYCAAIYGAIAIDEGLGILRRNQGYDRYMEELYGKGWDSPSAIDGIPELYESVLNQFYASVRDRWSAEQLMDLGAVSMPDYYRDASLDRIGFALMDLNGDDIDELVIGATGAGEGEGTVVFCVYANPECPYYDINSLEGERYYLHCGETDSTYVAEIVGRDAAWVIEPAASGGMFDCTERAGAMDPAGRLTLELIPFSQYK